MQMPRAVIVVAAGCVTVVGLVAQQAPPPKAAPAKPAAARAAASSPYKTIATVQDLMVDMVDPASKSVFGAVSAVETPGGIVEKVPKDDAEWAVVRSNAVTLAESANLLLMPRRVAVPANAQKHNEGELSPAVIEIMIAKDRAVWDKFTRAFRDAAMGAVKAAEAKRKEDFDTVNEAVDTSCENCHLHYWYPDQVELLQNAEKPK